MAGIVTLHGRTVGFQRKQLLKIIKDTLFFSDGDWFNARTGEGVHRYGVLTVRGGRVRMLQPNGVIKEPRPGQVYDVTH